MSNNRPLKNKEFLTLQQEWYDKLKAEGFEDIEQPDGNLKSWHSFYFALNHNEVTADSLKEYFHLATQFMHDNDFKSKLEQFIWAHHIDGRSVREIALLAKKNGFKAQKDKVRIIIQRIAQEMFKFYRDRRDKIHE